MQIKIKINYIFRKNNDCDWKIIPNFAVNCYVEIVIYNFVFINL